MKSGHVPEGHVFDIWEENEMSYRLVQGPRGKVYLESQRTDMLQAERRGRAWVPSAVARRLVQAWMWESGAACDEVE